MSTLIPARRVIRTVGDLKAILEDMPEDAEIDVHTGDGVQSTIEQLTLMTHHETFSKPETRKTYVTIWLY